MGKIIVLDENTSNKIAAGEVIERPASVVKELVENAIDAGATNISVEIRNGGISYLKVTDNGSGIDEDDVEIAFERHATSKIRNADDLETIGTLGFRGEALASIAAVSSVELTTRVGEKANGTQIQIQGGRVLDVKQTGCPVGTTFVIRDLFYNTPARFKFLKKDATEAGYISDMILRVALSKPHIAFKLISNHQTMIHSPGNNDLRSVIFSVYGKETAKAVNEVSYSDAKLKVTGFVGKPEIARATRTQQSIFVNGRYIKSKLVSSAVDEAYKTVLMKNKFPFFVLHLEVNPLLVDVNVHPTKMEIRFSDEQDIFRGIYHAVGSALQGRDMMRTLPVEEIERKPFRFDTSEKPKVKYDQQNMETFPSLIREKDTPPAAQMSDEFNPVVDEKKSLQGFSKLISENARNWTKPVESKPSKGDEAYPVFESNVKSQEIADTIQSTNNPEVKDNQLEPLFKSARIIGQVFSTYILLQNENEFILIDQHAAHERIMYEEMREKYLAADSLLQDLLSPVALEFTPPEMAFLEEEKNFFVQLGFKYENFGNNSILLRSVPYSDADGSAKESFLATLDAVFGKSRQDYQKIADDVLYTIACKAAVKANKHLDQREITSLLDRLSQLIQPFTCPHGRPTMIKLTKYDLEKMFKRIV